MENLRSFFKELKIKPHNKELYEIAFTHSSYNSDAKTSHRDYERLEFIGDSVLGFVVASLLFSAHPEFREGDLTKAKASLVQTKSLAMYARKEDFAEYIKVGHSISKEEVKNNNSILEDVFEAVIGAIYLDQGIKVCSKYISKVFLEDIIDFKMEEVKDYKSLLQEAMQAEYRESVHYSLIEEKGPPHDKTFFVEVSFNNIVLGRGTGKTKKAAEQKAAEEALSKKAG
ncbi:MAG TPA: ribonuclease III [Candidatus Onthovivens sp.]|nr:ribonuclease III [Candidatus Onthovivens sp.]